jgi:hypothetical protein
MPNPWTDSVKQTRQFTYDLSGVSGLWLTAAQDAVREFNAVSGQHPPGVTYVQTDQAPTDTGGANISIATANGALTFSDSGSHQTTVKGGALQGSTLLISRPNGPILRFWPFQGRSRWASARVLRALVGGHPLR